MGCPDRPCCTTIASSCSRPRAVCATATATKLARDDARLRRICLYRRTGLPLAEIGPLLIRPECQALAPILESQLHELRPMTAQSGLNDFNNLGKLQLN
jgi:MerR, DNA binding